MTNESRSSDGEIRGPFFSGWRKGLLWAIGAAALGIVGYRGALGTEVAAAATTPAASAPVTPSASASVAEVAHIPAITSRGSTPGDAHDDARAPSGGRAPAPEGGELEGAKGAARSHDSAPPAARSAAPAAGSTSAAGAGPAPVALTPDGRVVLNLASETELRKLPGIGKARARAIVEQRGRVGRFRRLEDLLRVKGIGPKRLAALRHRLVLDAPEGHKSL